MEIAGRVRTNNDSPSITETMQGGIKGVRKAERGYTQNIFKPKQGLQAV